MSSNLEKNQDVMLCQGKVTGPADFNEGGLGYRRNILASASLTAVLLMSSSLEPELFGVKVPVTVMWSFLGVAHFYFFVMWRLTSNVEGDKDKEFWNLKGLLKQAIAGGTKGFPGKTKAQILFIRSLPIWAFVLGMLGILYGLCVSF